jgi:DNA-binding transcriptional MerR regulator
MAARCGMTAHTLRYYERVGLIDAAEPERNGHRRYSNVDEAWLRFIHSLRATCMPIREIRRYAALRGNGVNDLNEQRKILKEHRSALEEQITELMEALSLLTAHIKEFEAGEQKVHSSPAHPRPGEIYVRHEVSKTTHQPMSARIIAPVFGEGSHDQHSNE